MKLGEPGDLWRSIKPRMKYVNAGSDVLAALIITPPCSPLAKMCSFVSTCYVFTTNYQLVEFIFFLFRTVAIFALGF